MPDLKKGDVVRLKSGGPQMTIEDVGDYGSFGTGPTNGAKCVWFDGKKKYEEVFDVDVIEKIPKATKDAFRVRPLHRS